MLVKIERTAKRIIRLKYANGILIVTANIFVPKQKIKQVIEDNMEWIKNQKEKSAEQRACSVAENATVAASRYFDETNELRQNVSDTIGDIFAGRKTVILGDVTDVLPCVSAKTHMEDNALYINEKLYNSKDLRLKAIASYLKRVAQIYVSSEVSKFGTANSLCPGKIEFKNVSQGWCKCSLAAEKYLCFDYRIAQLPENLRRYVIAHAFAHFYSAQHDEKYYGALERFAPNFADLRLKLEQYDYLKDV